MGCRTRRDTVQLIEQMKIELVEYSIEPLHMPYSVKISKKI